jgi:hypothetical protein
VLGNRHEGVWNLAGIRYVHRLRSDAVKGNSPLVPAPDGCTRGGQSLDDFGPIPPDAPVTMATLPAMS